MVRTGCSAAGALNAFVVLSLGYAAPTSPHPPAFESGYAPVNGLKMYYEIHGSANGGTPPLVLLHGGGSTIETSFGKILPGLAKTRQVIAFEQQGHGHTADIVDRPFTFEQSAEDAVACSGTSRSGRPTSSATATGATSPSRSRSGTRTWCETWSLSRPCSAGTEATPVSGSPSSTRNWKTCRRNCGRPTSTLLPIRKICPCFFAKSVQRMLDFKGWTPEEIQSIDAPTLVIIGDHDIVRPEHAVLMFRLLPNARLAVLPDTDHMTIVNRSDWLLSMIETFLDSPMPLK